MTECSSRSTIGARRQIPGLADYYLSELTRGHVSIVRLLPEPAKARMNGQTRPRQEKHIGDGGCSAVGENNRLFFFTA
jgi:hypothetical protein